MAHHSWSRNKRLPARPARDHARPRVYFALVFSCNLHSSILESRVIPLESAGIANKFRWVRQFRKLYYSKLCYYQSILIGTKRSICKGDSSICNARKLPARETAGLQRREFFCATCNTCNARTRAQQRLLRVATGDNNAPTVSYDI